jgi:sulfur transfer complex TusBCD TusB component (DsrH family)
MASILVVLTSPPAAPAGRHALALAESLRSQGHGLTLCCLQDAAVLGSTRPPRDVRPELERLVAQDVRCVVLQEDLVSRGLEAAPRAIPVDHAGLVARLAADHDRVIGAL